MCTSSLTRYLGLHPRLAVMALVIALAAASPAFAMGSGKPPKDDPPPDPPPVESPNMSITFRDSGILVSTPDGSEQNRVLADGSRGGTWSPDGDAIVFMASTEEDGLAMYLLPIDPCTGQSPTGVPLKITDVVNCCGDTFPAWSPVPAPNGEELIAYVQGSLFPAHVFVINPGWNGDLESPAVDPGPPIQLAPLNPGEDFQLGPTWSPTANRLAVASHADDYADIEVFALDADLAILPLGQRVTRTVLTRVVGFIVHMAWSRLDDTGMLAASYARDVFLVSVDSPGGTPINLTNTASALERGVDWSPDDKRMVVGRSDTIFRRNGKPLPGTVARTIVFDVDVGTPSLSDPIQIGADRDRPQWRRFDPVCP